MKESKYIDWPWVGLNILGGLVCFVAFVQLSLIAFKVMIQTNFSLAGIIAGSGVALIAIVMFTVITLMVGSYIKEEVQG